jgi:membrane protein YqaA with SNARE-associated domain
MGAQPHSIAKNQPLNNVVVLITPGSQMCYNAAIMGVPGKDEQITGARAWLGSRAMPLLTLLLVIAITVVIYFYRERVVELKEYAYIGAFLISLIGNATIILPVPVPLVLASLAAVFYADNGLIGAIIVGLAGGAGAAIGELLGYTAGYSGRRVVTRSKLYGRLLDWVRRWGTIAIFIFSLVPFFPFDLAGVAAGVVRFPLWKFLAACWLGRTILYIVVALAGALGWEVLVSYFG